MAREKEKDMEVKYLDFDYKYSYNQLSKAFMGMHVGSLKAFRKIYLQIKMILKLEK